MDGVTIELAVMNSIRKNAEETTKSKSISSIPWPISKPWHHSNCSPRQREGERERGVCGSVVPSVALPFLLKQACHLEPHPALFGLAV